MRARALGLGLGESSRSRGRESETRGDGENSGRQPTIVDDEDDDEGRSLALTLRTTRRPHVPHRKTPRHVSPRPAPSDDSVATPFLVAPSCGRRASRRCASPCATGARACTRLHTYVARRPRVRTYLTYVRTCALFPLARMRVRCDACWPLLACGRVASRSPPAS